MHHAEIEYFLPNLLAKGAAMRAPIRVPMESYKERQFIDAPAADESHLPVPQSSLISRS